MQITDPNITLPGAEPKMILLGAADTTVLKHLDEKLIQLADSIDIRSDVVWIEVDNCREYLRALVELIPPTDRVKVGISNADASPQEMIRDCLGSLDLVEISEMLQQEDLDREQLNYQIRYQPIVTLADRAIVGFEALLRAHDGDNAIISANTLIERATNGGWLAELDQLGRRLAISGIGPWLGEGLLFLNIMAPDGTFDLTAARQTLRHAEDVGLEPDQLVLETAERNRYTNVDLAAAQLNKLRNSGVRLAIDDMGDGYSTLVVATSFKPDVLKLAGDLIASLPSKESVATIKAVVDLAHSSDAWVVAENVETEAQADMLRSLDVDWAQGNLFGAPEVKAVS